MNTIPGYYVFIVIAVIFFLYGLLIFIAYIAKRIRGNEDDDLIRFRPTLLRGSQKSQYRYSTRISNESAEELDSVEELKNEETDDYKSKVESKTL